MQIVLDLRANPGTYIPSRGKIWNHYFGRYRCSCSSIWCWCGRRRKRTSIDPEDHEEGLIRANIYQRNKKPPSEKDSGEKKE